MEIITSIQNRIFEIRGERVMLDKDLAQLYSVETKVLNLAVKRNADRFPPDFMFQLTKEEAMFIRFQSETLNTHKNGLIHKNLEAQTGSRFQFETLKVERGKNIKYLPYAFTEQGIAMLSSVLNSEKAIKMNIAIMRAFVSIRRITLESQIGVQLLEVKKLVDKHDIQHSELYEAICDVFKNVY